MLEQLSKRIQHCCATLRRSRNKRNVGSCWLKSSTGFKLCATTRNNMQQGVQTNAPCNIQQCWELLADNVASICTGLKASPTGLAVRMISSSEDSLLLSIQYGLPGNMTTNGLTKLLHKKGRKGRGIISLMFPFNDKPIRLTQSCTQFKSPGVRILCVFYLHYNVAFTFK